MPKPNLEPDPKPNPESDLKPDPKPALAPAPAPVPRLASPRLTPSYGVCFNLETSNFI